MAPNALQRKLTAILSADVKGYSRLMGELLLSEAERPSLEGRMPAFGRGSLRTGQKGRSDSEKELFSVTTR